MFDLSSSLLDALWFPMVSSPKSKNQFPELHSHTGLSRYTLCTALFTLQCLRGTPPRVAIFALRFPGYTLYNTLSAAT